MNDSDESAASELFKFERSKPRGRALDADRTDGAGWLRELPQTRIAAVEFLRADFAGPGYAAQRLSRFLAITRQA